MNNNRQIQPYKLGIGSLEAFQESARAEIEVEVLPPAPQTQANAKSADRRLEEFGLSHSLWSTHEDVAYVTLAKQRHIRVESQECRDILILHGQRLNGIAPNGAAIDRIISLMGAKARQGFRYQVHYRIAGLDDHIYVDLANEAGEVVEVSPNGWAIRTSVPVRFIRSRGMRALPTPIPGGDVNVLREFINVETQDDFALVVGWILGSLLPGNTHPVLILNGAQGSGKTLMARILKELSDPAATVLRQMPANEADLRAAAANSWLIAFDNVSTISGPMSDAVCRMATGGTSVGRRLYTDADEATVDIARPVILNGIPELAQKPDLVDRAIIINLPVLPQGERRTERDIMTAFCEAQPLILGVLFDAIAQGLARRDEVRLSWQSRLLDWGQFVTAAEPALGWKPETILQALRLSQSQAQSDALMSDPVGGALIRFLNEIGRFEGTADQLRLALIRTSISRHLPDSPRAMANTLRRLAPALRERGYECSLDRITGGDRIWTIEPISS